MDIKALFRDYGAAIGPALAFALGFLTLLLKDWFDALSARRTARRLVSNLHKLILGSPPREFEPFDSTKSSGPKAAEIRNTFLGLTHYHKALLIVQSVLTEIEPRVNENGAPSDVVRLHQIKWALGNVIREVEKPRERAEAAASHKRIEDAWKALVETGRGEGYYAFRAPARSVPTSKSGPQRPL